MTLVAAGEKIPVSDTITTETVALEAILREDDWCLSNVGDKEDGFEVVDRVEGEDRRWTRTDSIIVKTPEGKFYSYDYESPLTECQEDSDLGATYHGFELTEVAPIEKTITVTEWKNVHA